MCLDLLGDLSKLIDASSPPDQLQLYLERYNALCAYLGLSPVSLDLHEVKKRLSLHLERASFIGQRLEQVEALGDRLEPSGEALQVCVYLENLRSGHNIGNIIRTAEALQIGSIYLTSGMCSKDHPSVKKAAMGAESWLPVIENASLEDLPKPIIALELTDDAKPIESFSFPKGPFTLALGNEACGLSQKALECAHAVVKIPLYGRKASLNVANAFAIVAHKICAQATVQCN